MLVSYLKHSLCLVLCLLGLALANNCPGPVETLGPGSTLHLDALYQGICFESTQSTLCPSSWDSFQQIVTSKASGSFSWDDFKPLFQVLNTTSPHGKSTFWNGDGILVHRLSLLNSNYSTLEDTFPAKALNGFFFCPSDSESSNNFENVFPEKSARSAYPYGFNTHNCTQYIPIHRVGGGVDYGDAFGAFWEAASVRFASEASGPANVVFQVPDQGVAFCPREFFGAIEIPHMVVGQVSSLTVMVATNPQNPLEKCDSGSFIELRALVESHFAADPQFQYHCQDDPYPLALVRCASLPQSDPLCKSILEASHGNPPSSQIPIASHTPKFNSTFKPIYALIMAGIGIGCFVIGFLMATFIPMLRPCKKVMQRSGDGIGKTSSSSSEGYAGGGRGWMRGAEGIDDGRGSYSRLDLQP